MDDTLTDTHLAWASTFCNVPDLTAPPTDSSAPANPAPAGQTPTPTDQTTTDQTTTDQTTADQTTADQTTTDQTTTDQTTTDQTTTDQTSTDQPPAAIEDDDAPGIMQAQGTSVFFALDKSDLTASDTTLLDAYAAAYLSTGTTDSIDVQGFASKEGDPTNNRTLADARASAVKAYLVGQGIPDKQVNAHGEGATDHFDTSDLRANRRAVLSSLPAAPATTAPPPATPDDSKKDWYALGLQAGQNGDPQICPDGAGTDDQKEFDRGYGDGVAKRQQGDLVRNIQTDLDMHDAKDLSNQLDKLGGMSMDDILDTMQALKQAGRLDDFAGQLTGQHDAIGAALLTIKGDFGTQWQALVAKMGDAGREAILKRTPSGTYPGASGPSPAAPPAAKGDGSPDQSGVVAVGTGAESQAKIKFAVHAGLLGDIEPEFTVHVGPDGSLSQLELDLSIVEAKLADLHGKLLKAGALAPLEITATLSGNTTADFSAASQKAVFQGVSEKLKDVAVQLKGEIEIKTSKAGSIKLDASFGSGGFSGQATWEFPIPLP